jgi:hypothetical protein
MEEDNKIFHTTTHLEVGEYRNALYPVLASDSTSFLPPPVEP